MRPEKKKRQAVLASALLSALFVAAFVSVYIRAKRMERIPYIEHLDDTAVTVDGTDYLFRDLAFYLAYQERETEKQARAYDMEHTSRYWNLRTNGSFIRTKAKDAVMDEAVHDAIFYQMARREGIALSKEEAAYLENQKEDFWNDLEEEGQTRLGVPKEEIDEVLTMAGLARKMQRILAEREGAEEKEYRANGSLYRELLLMHEVKINEALWERLNFGNITIH